MMPHKLENRFALFWVMLTCAIGGIIGLVGYRQMSDAVRREALARVVARLTELEVAALGAEPPLFAPAPVGARPSPALPVVLSILIATLSGLTSNIVAAYLQERYRLISDAGRFGLVVAEALWKATPVVGGNVGGIRLQVVNHHTGFLVDTPEGAALRIRELLRQPEKIVTMGKTAKEFVKHNFLLTRQLREYLTLMLGLQRNLENYLLAV